VGGGGGGGGGEGKSAWDEEGKDIGRRNSHLLMEQLLSQFFCEGVS